MVSGVSILNEKPKKHCFFFTISNYFCIFAPEIKTRTVIMDTTVISLCKVQSGGKDIKAALDAGQQLRVMTIDK
jgi:hypothetical protein